MAAGGGPARGQLLPHHQAGGAQAEGAQAGTSTQSPQIDVTLLCNTYSVLHDSDILDVFSFPSRLALAVLCGRTTCLWKPQIFALTLVVAADRIMSTGICQMAPKSDTVGYMLKLP